jgi:hypothetical protein
MSAVNNMQLDTELTILDCRVIDAAEASTETHKAVLLILAQTFNTAGATLLCEPSVVGGRSGPPDIAIIDPRSGVHTVEVKGVRLEQVLAVQAGGAIEIEYDRTRTRKDPSKQARQAMFDIKDASTRHFNGELNVPFQSWVAFPRIRRHDWEQKFGAAISSRPDVLFVDELESPALGKHLRRSGIERLSVFGLNECPPAQLQSVMAAFGDSAALALPPRSQTRTLPGSKGQHLEEEQAEYRALSEQQQRIASQGWNDGPRLVRGVAGSGKTIVLATQAARMLERLHKRPRFLFEEDSTPSVLVVCFNRTLVPFIQQRIEMAYEQRAAETLPDGLLTVTHFNELLFTPSREGFCRYRTIETSPDPGERAARCLSDLAALNGRHRDRLSKGLFYAVFVDEGQDFHGNEFQVLLKLCTRAESGPRMFVFYDDAQNLYGQKRPTWTDLGLELRGGRAVVLDQALRNTRQIIEPAFNVLLGTHAVDPRSVSTRGFADFQMLKDKQLISWDGRHIRVQFARREGDPIVLNSCSDKRSEEDLVARRCDALIGAEQLLPQDILVLTFKRERAYQLAKAIGSRVGADGVRCAIDETEKDKLVIQKNRVTVSTIASAKGYDAPFVLLASIEDCLAGVEGRATLYVGCTRAREWLEVSGNGTSPLMSELQASVAAMAERGG